MKRFLPWLKAMLGAVCAAGALAWSWSALHPAPSCTIEIAFHSTAPASVGFQLKQGTRKAPREAVSAWVGGCALDQTVSLDAHAPQVRTLAVGLYGDPKAVPTKAVPMLHSVKIRAASGKVLWEAPDLAGQWVLDKPVNLRSGHDLSGPPRWLCWTVGAAGVALAAGFAWRMWRRLSRGTLTAPVFGGVMVLAFVAAAVLYLAAIEAQRGAPLPSESWTHDLFIEKAALAEGFASPRVLLVGGSSGLYGVDTAWLSDQVGQPVVNLATHAGLPLRCHLDRCRALWRRGDAVLLHLEMGYWGDESVSEWQIEQALTWAWTGSSRRWLDPGPAFLVTHVPPARVFAGTLASWYSNAFGHPKPTRVIVPGWGVDTHLGRFLAPINSHGDLIQEGMPGGGRKPAARPYVDGAFRADTDCTIILQNFLADAKAHGVRVLFASPATIQSALADFLKPETKAWVDAMDRWIAAHGGVMLGRPEETQLPIELFLDTVYHLTPRGRALHSATLLRQLRAKGWRA